MAKSKDTEVDEQEDEAPVKQAKEAPVPPAAKLSDAELAAELERRKPASEKPKPYIPAPRKYSTPVKASEYKLAQNAPHDYVYPVFEVLADRTIHINHSHPDPAKTRVINSAQKVGFKTGRRVSEQHYSIAELIRQGVQLRYCDPADDSAES
jgi:hypothetical protein